jgi:hypothetical protein
VPSLDKLTSLVLQDARLSTEYGLNFGASNLIDNNLGTLAATQSTKGRARDQDIFVRGNERHQWASVSVVVPTGKAIGYVAVYNRDDAPQYASWLSPYEVWLGNSFGDLQHQCGDSLTAENDMGPFVTPCNGPTNLTFVTIIIRSLSRERWLTLSQIEVYARKAVDNPIVQPPAAGYPSLIPGKIDNFSHDGIF